MSLADALDQAARRGLLYVVIVSTQNELHSSVTLTILHGRNPQGKAEQYTGSLCSVTGVYYCLPKDFLLNFTGTAS